MSSCWQISIPFCDAVDIQSPNTSGNAFLLRKRHSNLSSKILARVSGKKRRLCSTICFDKGSAIAYLLKYFEISKDQAYAFGDGYNDQAMFKEAGHCIAMGNAVDVLKEKATYVTDTIENDGILKALYHEKVI